MFAELQSVAETQSSKYEEETMVSYVFVFLLNSVSVAVILTVIYLFVKSPLINVL